jgi:hypothetical protein
MDGVDRWNDECGTPAGGGGGASMQETGSRVIVELSRTITIKMLVLHVVDMMGSEWLDREILPSSEVQRRCPLTSKA